MLKDLGVQVVILGHSERRHTYLEWDELINRKLRLALRHGLEVILCVGETQEERDSGVTREVVERQLGGGLEGVVGGGPGPDHGGLRTGVGHRHRQDRHARRTPTRCIATSAP